MQLQRLEGFYWVARTEGYARAARAFPYPITQPGVHQQVRRLESDLETKLFERVGKDRVRLTPAGQALYAFVAPFLERLPTIEESIRSGRVGGTLSIHASPHLLRNLLPGWLRRVQAKHPHISLQVVEAVTPDLSKLRSGEADLLVDHLHAIPEDVAALQIATAKAFLVIGSSHPAVRRTGKASPPLQSLLEEVFIAYGADAHSRELQLEALKLHGVHPKKVHSANSAETILGLVAAGLGYSLVPSVLKEGPKEKGVRAYPLSRPIAEFPIYAAWRKTAAESPLLRAALELMA